MKEEFAKYEIGFHQAQSKTDAGQIRTAEGGDAAMMPFKDSIHAMEKAAEDLGLRQEDIMAKQDTLMRDSSKRTVAVMFSLVGLTIFLTVAVSIVISRGDLRPVNGMTTHLAGKAAGGGGPPQAIPGKAHHQNGPMNASVHELLTKLVKKIIST